MHDRSVRLTKGSRLGVFHLMWRKSGGGSASSSFFKGPISFEKKILGELEAAKPVLHPKRRAPPPPPPLPPFSPNKTSSSSSSKSKSKREQELEATIENLRITFAKREEELLAKIETLTLETQCGDSGGSSEEATYEATHDGEGGEREREGDDGAEEATTNSALRARIRELEAVVEDMRATHEATTDWNAHVVSNLNTKIEKHRKDRQVSCVRVNGDSVGGEMKTAWMPFLEGSYAIRVPTSPVRKPRAKVTSIRHQPNGNNGSMRALRAIRSRLGSSSHSISNPTGSSRIMRADQIQRKKKRF